MAPMDRCLASMARLSLAQPARPTASTIPKFLAPSVTNGARYASASQGGRKKVKKVKPIPKDYRRHRLEKYPDFPRFSLVEAMRILRASEVGKPPGVVKYELSINLKTFRNGPVVRSSIRLPNPVQSDWQIAVVCPEGSDLAVAAINAGAKAVGEKSLFNLILENKITFDRLICHESSEKALNAAGLGRILGPKGLMPNRKNKTIVSDVVKAIRDTAGAADYRERAGVVRLAVGQLGHSPEQLKANVEAVMKKIKEECSHLSDEVPKEVHEVTISTTHGPGISLNGIWSGLDERTKVEHVRGVM